MSSIKILLGVVVVAIVVALFSIYTVDERETAIKFRLGQIVQADIPAGIHFKYPVINNVRKFDARIQTVDSSAQEFLTSEKKNVLVDSFVKWRIADVSLYYKSMGGDVANARDRISQIIQNGLRNELGKRTIQEAVSGERAQLMDNLAINARQELDDFGIEIVDVRIKRIDLPEQVSSSVYDRMAAERARVAKDFRSRGEEEAERIRADADRQKEVLIAEAYRDAERIKGEGDAIAAKTYAKAYKKDPEFYALYRSLNAYQTSFGSKNDFVVMQPDADFFKYFKDPDGRK
jgi:membrane protease subunit HflC